MHICQGVAEKGAKEKDFKKSMKGYNVDEVDTFLNMIIEDYEQFEQQLHAIREENDRLKQELADAQNRRPTTVQPVTSNTNVDILRRLSVPKANTKRI